MGTKRRECDKGKGSKRKKIPTWTHTFICLARCDQAHVPDADERMALQLADLGEKRITFLCDAESWEIYNELLFEFPKLKVGGGFEMLRVDCGKMLQVIACPKNGYSVPYLCAVSIALSLFPSNFQFYFTFYFSVEHALALYLDFAGPFENQMFLVLVDAHSKWIETFVTHSSTSSIVIHHLRAVFARFGLPETIVTDNGSCFVSAEFEAF